MKLDMKPDDTKFVGFNPTKFKVAMPLEKT
jgi:hypothetical protein